MKLYVAFSYSNPNCKEHVKDNMSNAVYVTNKQKRAITVRLQYENRKMNKFIICFCACEVKVTQTNVSSICRRKHRIQWLVFVFFTSYFQKNEAFIKNVSNNFCSLFVVFKCVQNFVSVSSLVL